MATGKAMGSDGLDAELLRLGLFTKPLEILHHFHSIVIAVWTSGEVPQELKDFAINLLHEYIRIVPSVVTTVVIPI